jgi:hypothetical protein
MTGTKRWLIGLAIVAVLFVGAWVYIEVNQTGEIRGLVVDGSGRPIVGASVRLREKTLNLIKQGITTQTDAEGRFVFRDQAIIEFFIDARAEGIESEEYRYHLYFMEQDFELPDPIVIPIE